MSEIDGATLLSQRRDPVEITSATSRWLRVRIADAATNREKVDLRIPLDLVEVGLRMGARFVPTWEPADYAPILESAENGETGQLVEMVNDGEKIDVFIE